ncbi:hypothetical protein GE061_005471 [Apolygus lucorum]|uniref:Uncharacterized protein n=1 Tax=Apolygus lucorum TaxID=248454 RepID=A0A8S9WXQ7_APOLU|nr:hypothetical protein GE061_005471 [Apolygus lucorum]
MQGVSSASNRSSDFTKETDDLNCHCLPACSEIEYDADYVSQERNWPDYDFTTDETTNLKTSRNDTLYMSLKLSYRMKFILAVNRETASDFIDFVANVGGLLSLFTGFSILSLVEIFYFMSFKRRKMNKFQRQPNQMTNFYMKNVLF